MKSFQERLALFAEGKGAIVFDSTTRENEADWILAVEKADVPSLDLLLEKSHGLLCLALHPSLADSVGLPMMPRLGVDAHGTAFTLSIDHRSVRTGISTKERLITAKALLEEGAHFNEFITPGHIFPLISKPLGLLERQGHTEASVDLCLFAGLKGAAFICEMTGKDGVMMNREESKAFAENLQIPFFDIAELQEYKRIWKSNVVLMAESPLPTEYGPAYMKVYQELGTSLEHVYLSFGKEPQKGIVRIHSECMTGELFASHKCDCGLQLSGALKQISEEGGALVYLRQEGRGIGISGKIRAYALQERDGLDTVDANLAAGFEAEERHFHQAAWILKENGFQEFSLLTNNPLKIDQLQRHGLVIHRLPSEFDVPSHAQLYLKVKKERMGHLLKTI